jgi:hypothetical protein
MKRNDGEAKRDVQSAIRWYIYHSQWQQLKWRVGAYSLLMLAIFIVACSNIGFPLVHARGTFSWSLFWTITFFDVACLLCLLFLVFDTTLLLLIFTKGLGRDQTQWPNEVKLHLDLGKYIGEFPKERERKEAPDKEIYDFDCQFKSEAIDYLLDVLFIQERTKCVSHLVYYPFIVLAMMILSRSSLFANLPLSLPILITEVLGLVVVVGWGILMNLAAEEARRTASDKFAETSVRAKGLKGEGRRVAVSRSRISSKKRQLRPARRFGNRSLARYPRGVSIC